MWRRLISGERLCRPSGLQIYAATTLGQAWPFFIGLVVMPIVVHGLGSQAYGILAIISSVMGVMAFLDMGLRDASVKHVAHYYKLGQEADVRAIVSTNLAIFLAIGLFGVGLVWLTSPWIVSRILIVPTEVQLITVLCLRIAAIGFSINLLSSVFSSVVIAHQQFVLLNIASIFLVTINLVGNAGLVLLEQGILQLTIFSLAITCLRLGWNLFLARRLQANISFYPRISPKHLRELMSFGSMRLLGTLASTFSLQSDRLIIGSTLGVASVTYYVVPQRIAQHIGGFVFGLLGPLFPRVSELVAQQDRLALQALYHKATQISMAGIMVLACPITGLALPILTVWMGAAFAAISAETMRYLMAGWIVSSLWATAYHFNHGLGRPKINAVFSVVHTVLFVPVAIGLLQIRGIVGVAQAWLLTAVPLVVWVLQNTDRQLGLSTLRVWLAIRLRPLVVGVVLFVLSSLMSPFVSNLTSLILILGATWLIGVILVVVLKIVPYQQLSSILAQVFGRPRSGKEHIL